MIELTMVKNDFENPENKVKIGAVRVQYLQPVPGANAVKIAAVRVQYLVPNPPTN